MDRIDAMNWMEQWADRHQVSVREWPRIRAGEQRAGLVMELVPGEPVPVDALNELLAMGKQLCFAEMGPPPAPRGSAPAGGPGEVGSVPPSNNMGGRVTFDVFKGFGAGCPGLFAAVDQFTLVGKGAEKREGMKATLQKYLGDGQLGLFGLNTYKQSWHFDSGAVLQWSEGRDDWCLMARGQTLQLVGEEKHVQFMLDLHEHADHCTRVDPRLDDYSRKLIDLGNVVEAMEAGNFVGPRKCEVVTSGRLARGKLQREGATYVFGSRDSARVIFYDKGLESRGRILSNRLEVAYYKEKAQAAWVKLMNAARGGVEQFTAAVGQLVCGAIDFRQRGEHREIARMHRLSWWSAIVEKLGSVQVRVEKAVSSLNSSMASFVRQYAKKIARAFVVGEAKGHDLALQLVGMIEHLRDGQELVDRDISPLELEFEPLRAFKLQRC